MSPELQAGFVAQWPDLQRRLNALYARKGVPAPTRDDLVQETALRLIKIWDSVDMTRSPWPLTATIGLNLLRDRAKALATTEVLADLPDAPAIMDVEDAGIARVELQRVRRAMAELTEAQRTILLDEVGEGTDIGGTAASQKMLRMRARRKLRAILERVSGLIVLRHGRVSDWFSAAFASRDAIAQGAAACVACALVGSAFVAAGTPTPANARPLTSGRAAGTVLVEAGKLDRLVSATILKSAAATDGERSFRSSSSTGRRTTHATRLRPSAASSDQGTLPLPTDPGDSPVPIPPAPEVPQQDTPSTPSAPAPHELPTLPTGDNPMTLPTAALRVHLI
jgi:DNA-directed RNA polymerase specialized sigma24 family protein